MELMDVIRTRRAVREYTEAPIPQSTIERLIGAAILEPSAMNFNPGRLPPCSTRNALTNMLSVLRIGCLRIFHRLRTNLLLASCSKIRVMCCFTMLQPLVLVLAKSSAAQAMEDCCLAAQNLMLAARDEGLGTCWIGFARPWLDLTPTKRELGLPDDYRVIAPIVLGHPKAWPKSHGRNPAEIHWL
jgi:nitroreductase